jgi:hypothetical protein
VKDTDIIDSHPGNIALAGRPDSLKNSPVGNFKYAGAPSPLYSETLSEPDTPAPAPPPPSGSGFNINVRDTEANILARTGDATGVIAYGTDTEDLYVCDGTNWQTYNNS